MRPSKPGKTTQRVLLIFPPPWDVTSPYVALPRLASCLEECKASVRVCDLNLDLMRWIIGRCGSSKLVWALKCMTRHKRSLTRSGFHGIIDWAEAWAHEIYADHNTIQSAKTSPASLSRQAAWRSKLHIERIWQMLSFLRDANMISDRVPVPHIDYLVWRLERLLSWNPDIVAFSCPSPEQFNYAIGMSHFLRAEGYTGRIVVGGPAPTMAFGTIFGPEKFPEVIDTCVVGPGEGALKNLVNLARQSKIWPKIVDGWKTVSPSESLSVNYDLLPMQRYFDHLSSCYFPFTEGCYWRRCRYCSLTCVPRYREYCAGEIVKRIRNIARKTGYRSFSNSGSVMSAKNAGNLSAAFKKADLNIRWQTMARPEGKWARVNCRNMQQAGLSDVRFGVESLSERVLKVMQKGVTVMEQIDAIKSVCAAGIRPTIFLIMDHPGERIDDFRLTLKRLEPFARHLSNIQITLFQTSADAGIISDLRRHGYSIPRWPNSIYEGAYAPLPLARSNKRDRQLQLKKEILDRWILQLNKDLSLIFFRSDIQTSVLFECNDIFLNNRDPIRSGYFMLENIMERRYRLDNIRIKMLDGPKGPPCYVLRDQIRAIPVRSLKGRIINCIERGLSVEESFARCGLSSQTDIGAYADSLQMINTLDLMGAIRDR